MRYRRSGTAGDTYFFTVNPADRRSRLLLDHVGCLRDADRLVKARHPFQIIAWVTLPEHLHTVWVLPPGDVDFAMRWGLIKSAFSRSIESTEAISAIRRSKGERGIWQRRYWEHLIRDEVDLQRHVDYVHWNPVKHAHVMRASDWPHSSIHRFIAGGELTVAWACKESFATCGERC